MITRDVFRLAVFKSHAGPIQEAREPFSGALFFSGRYNNVEFNFGAIGYWLRPHVVENGGVGREGLASANQSHRSHFFHWRRISRFSRSLFSFSLFTYTCHIFIYIHYIYHYTYHLFIYIYITCTYLLFLIRHDFVIIPIFISYFYFIFLLYLISTLTLQ